MKFINRCNFVARDGRCKKVAIDRWTTCEQHRQYGMRLADYLRRDTAEDKIRAGGWRNREHH